MFKIVQILASTFLLSLGLIIECACQLTYTRYPNEHDAAHLVAGMFLIAGLIISAVKEDKG